LQHGTILSNHSLLVFLIFHIFHLFVILFLCLTMT